jgi:sec-independent protein translocase protein TatA
MREGMQMLAFLGPTGGWEWIIVLIIALLLFGRRLPKVMKSMGEGVRMFKKGVGGEEEGENEDEGEVDDAEADGPYQEMQGNEDSNEE